MLQVEERQPTGQVNKDEQVPPPHVKKPDRPRLGCAVIVEHEGKILMGVRAKEPFRGKWVIPGGGVKFLESFRETAKREILEEVGIEIDVDRILDVREIVTPPDEHRVIIYCAARYAGGQINPSSDLSEVRFFTRDEVRSLLAAGAVTPTVESVIKESWWNDHAW